MSSIWHTTDEAPESYVDIAFYVDGYLYFASYQPQYNQYGIFGADKVEKWCYVKELSPYILALETELEHTRKQLEVAEKCINWVIDAYKTGQDQEADVVGICELTEEKIKQNAYGLKGDACRVARKALEQIKQTGEEK